MLRAAEGTNDQEGTYEELKARILPLVLSSEASQSRGPAVVTQPLINGLIIAYAIDSDRTISYLGRPHFASWNITLDELHETAMQNLVSRSEAMSAHAADPNRVGHHGRAHSLGEGGPADKRIIVSVLGEAAK